MVAAIIDGGILLQYSDRGVLQALQQMEAMVAGNATISITGINLCPWPW